MMVAFTELPDSDAGLDSVDLNEENDFQSVPVHHKSRPQQPTFAEDADIDDENTTQPLETNYESSGPGHPSDVDHDEKNEDEQTKQLEGIEKIKGKKVCTKSFLSK